LPQEVVILQFGEQLAGLDHVVPLDVHGLDPPAHLEEQTLFHHRADPPAKVDLVDDLAARDGVGRDNRLGRRREWRWSGPAGCAGTFLGTPAQSQKQRHVQSEDQTASSTLHRFPPGS